jgi:hypothetical protein
MKNFVPFAKSKKDKNGHVIHLQTMQVNGEWVVDTFEDKTYIGREKGFARLVDAIKHIDSEIEKV